MLSSLKPHSVSSKELTKVYTIILHQYRLHPNKSYIIKNFQDSLPVKTLFCTNNSSGRAVLFKISPDYLLLQENTYTQYAGKRELSYGIAKVS